MTQQWHAPVVLAATDFWLLSFHVPERLCSGVAPSAGEHKIMLFIGLVGPEAYALCKSLP